MTYEHQFIANEKIRALNQYFDGTGEASSLALN
jgi:hypothetical protein